MTESDHKTRIDVAAPMSRVAGLLAELAEIPRKYDGDVHWSNVVERGEDYHVNEICFGAASVRERVTRRALPDEVHYSFHREGGTPRTICCKEASGKVTLELGGHDVASLGRIAQRLKEAAEHPPHVPEWLQTYFDTVDRMDLDALVEQVDPACIFQGGNMPELRGRDAFRAVSISMWSKLSAIQHHMLSVYEDQGRTIAEVMTDFTLRDGRRVLLPAVTFFRRSGDLVSSVRIYGDMGPLYQGWPTLAH